MKANFKLAKSVNNKEIPNVETSNEENKQLTKEEFEEYIINSGAKGSFMIYRSNKKEEELGIDEL